MDALAVGSLVHEKGLATKVAAGSLYASFCPVAEHSEIIGHLTRPACYFSPEEMTRLNLVTERDDIRAEREPAERRYRFRNG